MGIFLTKMGIFLTKNDPKIKSADSQKWFAPFRVGETRHIYIYIYIYVYIYIYINMYIVAETWEGSK